MKLGRLRIRFQTSKLLKLPKFSNVANAPNDSNDSNKLHSLVERTRDNL